MHIAFCSGIRRTFVSRGHKKGKGYKGALVWRMAALARPCVRLTADTWTYGRDWRSTNLVVLGETGR